MATKTIGEEYWMNERPLGRGCILLSGKYNYIDKVLGYTMDNHIGQFIDDYDIVSHSIENDHGLSKYTVIMRHRTKTQ